MGCTINISNKNSTSNLSDVSKDCPGASGEHRRASEGTRPKLFLLSWRAKELRATLAVLFEKVMSILVAPSDREKVPRTSSPWPASPDSHTAFGLASATERTGTVKIED